MCVCVRSGRQQQQLGRVWEEFRDGADASQGQRRPQGADRGHAPVRWSPALPQNQSPQVPPSQRCGGHPAGPR